MASSILGSSEEILVAVDAEGHAREALAEALRLGSALGRHVHLLHAVEARRRFSVRSSESETREVRARSREAIRALLRDVADGDQAPTVAIAEGHPVQVVLEAIEERKPALLVVGRHGAGRRRDVLLGTTASRLVRSARCPVLIRRGPFRAKAPILVPVDMSPESIAALEVGAHLAEVTGSTLYSLFVYQPPDFVYAPEDKDLDYVVAGEREAMLEEYRRSVMANGLDDLERALVTEGDPAQQIASKADELDVDMVILGTHGRTGLSRWALGSVAETMVERTSHSLLTVKLADRDFLV